MTDLRARALRLVAAAEDPTKTISLIKQLRDLDGAPYAHLLDHKAAIEWAQANPAAATLPAGSVVATTDLSWIKTATVLNPDVCYWQGTDGGDTFDDADIDEVVRAGRACILRVGDGS